MIFMRAANDVVIRKATPSDRKAISSFASESGIPALESRGDLKLRLLIRKGQVFVAEDASGLIGFHAGVATGRRQIGLRQIFSIEPHINLRFGTISDRPDHKEISHKLRLAFRKAHPNSI